METLKLNSAIAQIGSRQTTKGTYDELVSTGSLLVCEALGREKNNARLRANQQAQDFGSIFTNNAAYISRAKEWGEDLLRLCAKQSLKVLGRENEFNESDRNTYTKNEFATDPTYLRVLASVAAAIFRPITPTVTSEIVGMMATTITTPKGKTKAVKVNSNAIITWEDATPGSLRNIPTDRLNNRTVVFNPTYKGARASLNVYQMFGDDMPLSDTLLAIAKGHASKVAADLASVLATTIANTTYVPSARRATSFTGLNWATVCRNVARANGGIPQSQLMAVADILALRLIKPDDATLASAIMMQLGGEYYTDGFIGTKDKVRLFEFVNPVTPSTLITTMGSVFPTNTAYILPIAGAYAPLGICFEEGAEFQMQMTPTDQTMMNGEIDVLASTAYEIKSLMATAIGYVSGIA